MGISSPHRPIPSYLVCPSTPYFNSFSSQTPPAHPLRLTLTDPAREHPESTRTIFSRCLGPGSLSGRFPSLFPSNHLFSYREAVELSERLSSSSDSFRQATHLEVRLQHCYLSPSNLDPHSLASDSCRARPSARIPADHRPGTSPLGCSNRLQRPAVLPLPSPPFQPRSSASHICSPTCAVPVIASYAPKRRARRDRLSGIDT